MTELIEEMCKQAGLQYDGVGYNDSHAFVFAIGSDGERHSYTFPQIAQRAYANQDRPSFPQESDIYLRSASLSQIADELFRRSTLTCHCHLHDILNLGHHCPDCNGTGRVPWIELRKIVNFLRDIELPV